MYKQPLTAISAGTIFKSRRQILKHSVVLDRFIRQINIRDWLYKNVVNSNYS